MLKRRRKAAPSADPTAPSPKGGRVVAAVGTASGTGARARTDLAQAVEAAMRQAALECHEQGIIDPDQVRKAMMAARQRVKDAAAANLRAMLTGNRPILQDAK